ncbi:protein AF-10 isoform X2 [Tribolium castaneum]|uniref:protein AF-10 isoform X2 n=1 Tax=Tribolium castaneum TaxID=7070 RepID=UPI00046C3BFB|nr:PREDICTED: protein AF-10 isoform X2 [Tribolium castaneum]|eukprot:XP_008193239.1 PREDICTED: protein AF-10 isoform X2 [Tribolium castaneum]
MREMVGGCCVCSDDRGWSENPLVYCDGQSCTVAVHQACYGIVTVPTGPWYCRKCESQERSVKVKCELCPSKHGALKRTDNSGWAHVVCALYIPEVRFGNVTTMEPIQLQLIPTERFNKTCYICEEKGKASSATVGACMQCNKAGCKQQFHVTCAQSLGLLCEEAGNYLDNVKYCGYCQHHYSKLKGGNVKTIPPYKPVSTENHLSDSNSEKEAENNASTKSSTSSSQLSSSKRKTSSSSKASSSKTSSSTKSSSSSSSSHQKTVHNSSKSSDKLKVSSSSVRSSAKSAEDNSASVESGNADSKTESRDNKVDLDQSKTDVKDSKSSKKRKNNSRTPTPVALVSSETVSVVNTSSVVAENLGGTASAGERKGVVGEPAEKPKKIKVETTQSILTNQPIVALTSISTIKTISNSSITSSLNDNVETAPSPSLPPQSIIQSGPPHSVNSLVVSVPLTSTSLSPHPQIINNQASVVTPTPIIHSERSVNSPADRDTSNTTPVNMTGGSSNQGSSIITSEMSGGGLKITYEKQDAVTMEVDMELEVSPSNQDLASKRSHSVEKSEKGGRGKKRNSGGANGIINQLNNTSISSSTVKRSSRSQNSTPPQPGAFASISQSQIKDSPPSSPSSESQSAASVQNGRGKSKSRKSAPSSLARSQSPKDMKDIKFFQNGVTAPHMLGNQLNPNSNMAQKMSDHLNSELEAHSIFSASDNSTMMGPQLHHRVIASARASSAGGSSTASAGSGFSSMLGGGGGNIPQTLDQLLERQWEQGSQFLMEQAQHFDIASLLSCLHQLRAENLRLEEHVSSLLQRRDHLLAVNARLAIPLTGQPATPQSSHAHTVNNIHPAVGASHGDVPRSGRHSGNGANYPAHPQGSQHPSVAPVENGLASDPSQPYPSSHSHRSPATSQSQPSPSVRHSPAGSGYPNSGLLRQNADTSGRSAPRPQPYPLYQGQGPSSQQQMVIRRDSDIYHQSTSKPS